MPKEKRKKKNNELIEMYKRLQKKQSCETFISHTWKNTLLTDRLKVLSLCGENCQIQKFQNFVPISYWKIVKIH